MSTVVGIDLGTTNTVVAAMRDGQAQVLTDDGRPLIPSVVSFHDGGHVVVGEEARASRLIEPTNTIYSIKRLIGRSWGSDEVQRARKRFPFELREGPGHAPLVATRGETFTLPEISAFVLRKAKQVAEEALGTPVDRAVITVPANFNDLQRAATKVAGRIAGLEVLRILNEPTAAAVAYGLGRKTNERIAVYDFGGGTFDVTLLDLAGNVFEVLATAGNTFLGGDDIDAALANRIAEQFIDKHGYDPRSSAVARERLRASAEHVKIALSTRETFEGNLPELANKGGQWFDLQFSMTRAELDEIADPIVSSTFKVCDEALTLAGLGVTDFDQVLLVGGSTRLPLVKSRVHQFFGAAVRENVNPDEVVALGAAVQAAALMNAPRRSVPPRSVPSMRRSLPPPLPPKQQTPSSIPPKPPAPPRPSERPRAQPIARIETVQQAVMPRAEYSEEQTPTELRAAIARAPSPPPAPTQTWQEPPAATQAWPDTAGAQVWSEPASTQEWEEPTATHGRDEARIPTPPPPPVPVPTPLLIDVTPLSLSVETVGGYCDKLIARNTHVPCEESRTFVTTQEQQTVVRVRVCQGESEMFAQNTLLGEVELTNIVALARGQARISVGFELDADGILQVRARDEQTGKVAQARLRLHGLVDANDVESLVARQEEHSVG